MLRKTMGLAMPLKLQMEKKAVKKVCLQSTFYRNGKICTWGRKFEALQ